MRLKKFVFSPFQENTYVIWDEITRETYIIDPGCFNSNEEEILRQYVESNNLSVTYLINTHCHIDHVFGNAFVLEKWKPEFIAPEKDVPLLKMVVEQGKQFAIEVKPSPDPNEFITEDMVLNLNGTELRFLFTPGHTPGEYSIYIPDENLCITGDVLFRGSIGRTDLWGGDFETLMHSIKTKLLVLPDSTTIYPGHGESSTILQEKTHNSFLQ